MTTPAPSAHPAWTSHLPLVGRAAALDELSAWLAGARDGRGQLVLLTGEPGIGKTRLAAEVVDRAAGFTTAWAWCVADPAAGSFRPWVQAIRDLAAANSDAAHVLGASPYLAGLVARDTPTSDAFADVDAVRWQFFDAVAEVVRRAAVRQPVLLVLDDVHDAQESSLWLLAHLLPTLRSSAALVLATARAGEHAWHGHIEARAALLRQAISIRLNPLSLADVGQLLGNAAGASLADRVLARTGGNPLLVTELVRLLESRPDAGRSAVAAAIPDSVRAITAERLIQFDPAAQRLLSAAAVLGSTFALDVLAAVGEVELRAIRDGLADAERGGLVSLSEPGIGRFVHELIRDALYERVTPAERARWHDRAGSVLAALAERGRDIVPAEIAHQFLLAGPEAASRAAEFAVLAGDRSARLLAYEDAASWYQRALPVLDLAGADQARHAAVLLALGDARVGCGDRAGAREAFLRAATLARAADAPELLARAALGLGSGPVGFEVGMLDRPQLDLLEEARALLPESQIALRALVTARLSVAATSLESAEWRLALAEEALRLARLATDDIAQASAVAALCDVLAGPEHRQARLAYASEIVERAARLRNPPLELLGRRLRLVALLETGDRPAVDVELTAFRSRAESFGHPLYSWYVPLWRAMWALAEGRFAECRVLNDQVEAAGRGAGSENAYLLMITQRWCLLAETNDRAGVQHLFTSVDFDQVVGMWARVTAALVQAQIGDLAEARRRLDTLTSQVGSIPRDSEWLPCIAQIAETVGFVGPHPIARWTYDALLPFAELFVVEGIGAAIRGPVSRHLGLLAVALGDEDRARAHFAAALTAARAFGAPGLVDRIEREQAVVLSGLQGTAVPDDNAFHRDGEYWTIRFDGLAAQLRDSKGLRDLAILLASPTAHVAALDLATSRGGSAPGSRGTEGTWQSDSNAGEILDAAARDAYRQRLVELEEEAAEADATGDVGRSEHLSTEREALVEQLTAAYGLGGRARRAGSIAERARSAVTARIRDAIRRIGHVHPALGRHLVRSVRTGTFCVYEPELPTRWQT